MKLICVPTHLSMIDHTGIKCIEHYSPTELGIEGNNRSMSTFTNFEVNYVIYRGMTVFTTFTSFTITYIIYILK